MTPEQTKLAELISLQTAELDTLASKLLQKARLDLKEIKLNQQEVSVSQLIDRALTLKAGRLTAQQVKVSTGLQNIFVRVDEELIGTAIGEFVENATKYCSAGSPIQVSALEDDSQVLISVHNLGPVIALEDRSRIFERFYRTDAARSRKQGGSGLGLSICKHIIEAHGQVIHVRSKPDVGSTFGFTAETTK